MSGLISRRDGRKLQAIVSILDGGGIVGGPRDGTNTAALQRLYNAGHRRIRFPAVGAGVYEFDGSLPAALTQGVTLDVDPGVVISVLDIGYIDPSARVLRPTKLYLSALDDDYWMVPDSHASGAARPVWLAERDGGAVSPVDCTSGLSFLQVTSNQDGFAAFAPTAYTARSVTITVASGLDYRVAFRKMQPGEEVSAQFTDAQSSTPLAMVRTASSYYGMAVDVGDVAQPTSFAKAVGGGMVYTQLNYPGLGTHSSYAAYKSLWTIRVNTVRNFSILFNGMEIHNVDTDDEIIMAGFGAQGAVGGSVVVRDWTSTAGRTQAAGRAINVAFFGDSITAPTFNGSWPTQLATMLDQHYGMRVNFVQNYAVSGASSSDQRPLCTAANVASYDVVCIMIGANDIQLGVSEADYETNLTAMINTVKGAGKRAVVGVPTMFYGRDQAGVGKGQATQRYDLGKGIRAKCLRVCAELGVPVVNTLEHMGPILGDWVNGALSPVANLFRDPMVFDSIHPTQFGKLVLARSFASVIAGLYMRAPTLRASSTPLAAAGLRGNWKFTTQPGQWARDDAGVVTLSGTVDKGDAIASGTIVYQLPENIRPLRTVRFAAWCDSQPAMAQIDAATGNLSIWGFPAGGLWLSLDGMTFPTR